MRCQGLYDLWLSLPGPWAASTTQTGKMHDPGGQDIARRQGAGCLLSPHYSPRFLQLTSNCLFFKGFKVFWKHLLKLAPALQMARLRMWPEGQSSNNCATATDSFRPIPETIGQLSEL